MNNITKIALKIEKNVIANNYKSAPVLLTKGKGLYLWDKNDKNI